MPRRLNRHFEVVLRMLHCSNIALRTNETDHDNRMRSVELNSLRVQHELIITLNAYELQYIVD